MYHYFTDLDMNDMIINNVFCEGDTLSWILTSSSADRLGANRVEECLRRID